MLAERLPVLIICDHLIRKRNRAVGFGELLSRDPHRFSNLLRVVNLDLVAPLNITDAADHQIGGKAPGLRLVIPDIDRLQAGLFHHLAAHGIFNALPDLDKTCDQRGSGIAVLLRACRQMNSH